MKKKLNIKQTLLFLFLKVSLHEQHCEQYNFTFFSWPQNVTDFHFHVTLSFLVQTTLTSSQSKGIQSAHHITAHAKNIKYIKKSLEKILIRGVNYL